MDVAHTVSHSKAGEGDGYRLRIRVSSTSNGDESGMSAETVGDGAVGVVVLIHGSLESDRGQNAGAAVRAILSGQGGRKSANLQVKLGDVVGIKSPWWDVEIKGKRWIVGADWDIL